MKDLVWYVAGPFADRPAVREIISAMNATGWQTCSRWADPSNPDVAADDPERESKLRTQAIRDVEDCITADGLIYVNSKKSEGKATELGMAIATLKPILIVGGRDNNIFLNLNIPAFQTIEEALEWAASEAGQDHFAYIAQVQVQHRDEEITRWLDEQRDDDVFDATEAN